MKTKFVIVALILMNALPLAGATKDDGWENLRHVTWQLRYSFLARDLHCITGEIVSVNTNSVTLNLPKGDVTKLDRADVLRVTSGSYYVYSGRSSWSDVRDYKAYPGEGARIQMKSGRTHTGKVIGTSDSEITIGQTAGNIKIAKDDVSEVDIISD